MSLIVSTASAQETKGAVVLDTGGYWRLHYRHKPPGVRIAGGLKPVTYETCLWINRSTASLVLSRGTWRRYPVNPHGQGKRLRAAISLSTRGFRDA